MQRVEDGAIGTILKDWAKAQRLPFVDGDDTCNRPINFPRKLISLRKELRPGKLCRCVESNLYVIRLSVPIRSSTTDSCTIRLTEILSEPIIDIHVGDSLVQIIECFNDD